MGWWKIADVIFANGVTKEISKKVRKQKKNTQKKHRKKKKDQTPEEQMLGKRRVLLVSESIAR